MTTTDGDNLAGIRDAAFAKFEKDRRKVEPSNADLIAAVRERLADATPGRGLWTIRAALTTLCDRLEQAERECSAAKQRRRHWKHEAEVAWAEKADLEAEVNRLREEVARLEERTQQLARDLDYRRYNPYGGAPL